MAAELKPLQEWICDKCGEVIASPTDGCLEWLADRDSLKISGFKVVHHAPASPYRAKDGNCYHYSSDLESHDMHLDMFLGLDGLARMVAWTYSPGVKSAKEWAEVFRRLHIPRYEEARRHWNSAQANGYFAEIDEESRYSQQILQEVIEQYGESV